MHHNLSRCGLFGAGILVLAACQTATDPQTGQVSMRTPTLGQLLGSMGGNQQLPGPASSVGTTSHWSGQTYGVTSSVDLTSLGSGRYHLHDDGGGNGCGMQVEGIAVEQGRGHLIFDTVLDGNRCVLDFRSMDPNHLSLHEVAYQAFHGMRCDFNTTLTRVPG